MKPRPRKGLQDIRSVVDRSGGEKNPQRKFLRLATLELRKTLCNTVKEAARRRLAEMDRQLAEIIAEQSEVLQTIQAGEHHHARHGATPTRSQRTVQAEVLR
jgi:hypothetical protein